MSLRPGSLVLYKNGPARVQSSAKKVEIELSGGQRLSVRPKDVALLHPGPLSSLNDLCPQEGEVETAWELLSGERTTLKDLVELAYGAYTPATAWAAWQWVADGLYFWGDPEEVLARSPAEVAQEQAARAAQAAERQAWAGFLERARAGPCAPEDERYLKEIDALALGRSEGSRALRELGRSESPENAHALLLTLGCWDRTVVPYPARLQLPTAPPDIPLPDLPNEPRRDLTHLPAWAIDDAGNQDPDDAISLEMTPAGRCLWVHVADVAALILPDSPADLEARARGATLYLPDGNVPMLPPQAVQRLGLGLAEISPALSFGLDLDDEGGVPHLEITPSWVRVTRLTYEQAETALDQPPLRELHHLAQAHLARRRERGAVFIQLPEVKIRVRDGEVIIRPLPALNSRALVREAMLMAGEAVARFALEQDIPLPFTTHDPPDTLERPDDLAGMYALRRTLRRSEHSSIPGPHAGLGLELYTRATSPLRRYLDLVVHQQLRAHRRGEGLLEAGELLERIGAAEAVTGSVRQAERLSRQHWTLVYLMQHPDWQGEGILVDKRERRGTLLIPDLDLETRIHLSEVWPLNSAIPLRLVEVDLPQLEVYFRAG
ncbi:MAG TPA: RNB domain-containing ribonuclease [Chloroflexi bacterium]|nr:RNB domain-containing ribonuclease [Chloroflexota bacterium]